ncbi:MAG TPA: PilN domain-containing protein [Xanthobacteraceae bacterium]|nr:PilN domain-containing protein [Xanthobacteraceae bacterium]
MKVSISSYLRKLGAASPDELMGRFCRWWVAEFVDLFPPRVAEWLTGKDRRRLVLSLEPERVGLEIQGGAGQGRICGEIERSRYSPDAIDRFLVKHSLRRADVDIAIRLHRERIFQRRFLLPLAAESAIEEVALRDLTRRTPFKPADIHHDVRAARAPADKIEVVQWVVRRSVADQMIAALQMAPGEVACLVGDPPLDVGPAPLIRLSRGVSGGASWLRACRIALIATGIALAVALVAGKLWRQQIALDDLANQLADLRPRAQQVRALVNGLDRTQAIIERIRSRKRDDVRFLDAWEEATRVVPHDTWLTELRLVPATEHGGEQVVMTGFSTAAARLVGLIDASPMFSDASLTAPISRDNTEERERFSIEAALRPHGAHRGAQ